MAFSENNNENITTNLTRQGLERSGSASSVRLVMPAMLGELN